MTGFRSHFYLKSPIKYWIHNPDLPGNTLSWGNIWVNQDEQKWIILGTILCILLLLDNSSHQWKAYNRECQLVSTQNIHNELINWWTDFFFKRSLCSFNVLHQLCFKLRQLTRIGYWKIRGEGSTDSRFFHFGNQSPALICSLRETKPPFRTASDDGGKVSLVLNPLHLNTYTLIKGKQDSSRLLTLWTRGSVILL